MQLSNSQKTSLRLPLSDPFCTTPGIIGAQIQFVVPAGSSSGFHPEAAGNEGGLRGSAEDSGLPTPGP